jgi:hypothetical protein
VKWKTIICRIKAAPREIRWSWMYVKYSRTGVASFAAKIMGVVRARGRIAKCNYSTVSRQSLISTFVILC